MPEFKYVGKGASILGIPARDLSAAEAEEAGVDVLRESDLYQEVRSSKTSKKKKEEIDDSGINKAS